MKIFIQANKYQYPAAKVAKYSFSKFNLNDVDILHVDDFKCLKKNFKNKYLRNSKLVEFKDDLQSFTLLRFFAPKIMNYSGKCIVIDPDVFAVRDPSKLISECFDEASVMCTFYNNSPRSEVMMLNCKKINWDYEDIINKVFQRKIDYKDLMNLSFDKNLIIKEIGKMYNSHDKILSDTILLHTTNRITQPWKNFLKVDFEKHNVSFKEIFVNRLKFYLGLSYRKDIISNNYYTHPDKEVIKFIKDMFKEAINKKILTKLELEDSLKKKYISRFIIE
jgi:hypothetical protein